MLNLLAAGASQEEILADYDDLELADIRAVLQFAAKQNDHPMLRSAMIAVSRRLTAKGFPSKHVSELGLQHATDIDIFKAERYWLFQG